MNTQKLEKFIDSLGEADIRAIECVVYKDHEKVFQKCFGHSDAEQTKPLAPNNLYWLFSATKVITCLAGVKLVDEGKMSLDDPVSKYIPEFADVTVLKDGVPQKAEKEMKLWHLFTMTGGFTYDLESKYLLEKRVSDPKASTLEVIKALAKDPLASEPGEHYRYSLCHDVLAAVIEIVSGMKFSEYLKKNFFEPLNIKDLGFFPNDEQKSRFVTMFDYNTQLNRSKVRANQNNGYILTENYESGGAGLFGAASEYVKIIDAIASGGVCPDGTRLMSENAVMMMTKNYLDDTCRTDFVRNPRKYGYGWGLCGRVHMNPVASCSSSPVGEFGWDGAAAAYVLLDPFNKISIFCTMHTRGCDYAYEKIHTTIRNLVYED